MKYSSVGYSVLPLHWQCQRWFPREGCPLPRPISLAPALNRLLLAHRTLQKTHTLYCSYILYGAYLHNDIIQSECAAQSYFINHTYNEAENTGAGIPYIPLPHPANMSVIVTVM